MLERNFFMVNMLDQKILKILSSGKSLDRYERILHCLNAVPVDSNEYEEQPKQSSKRIRCLAYGFISSRKAILIIKE